MRRMASVIRLRPEHEAEYRRLHADPPAEVLDALRAAHIANFSIYLRDGLLFSYFEYLGDDYAADSARLAADEATTEHFGDVRSPAPQGENARRAGDPR